jgi:hypothetical protein
MVAGDRLRNPDQLHNGKQGSYGAANARDILGQRPLPIGDYFLHALLVIADGTVLAAGSVGHDPRIGTDDATSEVTQVRLGVAC